MLDDGIAYLELLVAQSSVQTPSHASFHTLVFRLQGFFSPVVLQEEVLATPVSLHLFEYTAR